MILIATIDENWALSRARQPLVQIPANNRFFQKETTGKTVLMGPHTLESFPGGQVVGGRNNIVLAPAAWKIPRTASHATSAEEVLALTKDIPSDDIYIIGGASIYESFLPYCTRAYITYVEYTYDADRYLMDLSKSDEWQLMDESEEQTYYDLIYYFRTYERIL